MTGVSEAIAKLEMRILENEMRITQRAMRLNERCQCLGIEVHEADELLDILMLAVANHLDLQSHRKQLASEAERQRAA